METPQTAAAASLVNAAPETISNDTDPATDDQDAEEEAYLDTIDANPDTIEDYGRSQFRARALVVALEKLVKEAAASPDSPSASASRMEHDGYWRKVFTQTIIPTVVADDSIENSLFDPPRNKLGIVVACEPTGGLLCCPCDMPNSFLPTVEVEAAEADRVANGGAGVGKRALLEGLTAALYGTSEGKTGFIGGDGERFVLGRCSWMTAQGVLWNPGLYLLMLGWEKNIVDAGMALEAERQEKLLAERRANGSQFGRVDTVVEGGSTEIMSNAMTLSLLLCKEEQLNNCFNAQLVLLPADGGSI